MNEILQVRGLQKTFRLSAKQQKDRANEGKGQGSGG